ncbi:DNA recombination protein RmuC [Nonomuraea sp. KC401]|uniref:DNA recombination protein RmuC n=1 Tax=unclassified Nonomuraea TaxID=2593643 RepID=UPI0010FF3992|nr:MULTISPECIES: DNA recombination protein RmuC [unclassified Nonomuraea]NBE94102.1 DNA recombination protein RmuC [Nonomuraea sp. K271]TLF62971.1 DNA recombination protein RmuC [Nonomuraea sp. KC401]
MTSFYLVVLAIVLTLVSAMIAYLIARGRAADERVALKLAEEQRTQAAEQANALRAERDKAQRQLADLSQAHTTALTERRTLDEQLGRFSAELEATRSSLKREEADAQRLQLELQSEQTRGAEVGRRLRETELSITELKAKESVLRSEIQDLKTQLAELVMQKQALLEQAATVQAVRQELDQTRSDNNRLLEETLRAATNEMLKKSQAELVTMAETTLNAASKPVHDQLSEMDRQLKEFSTTRIAAEATLNQRLITLTEEGQRTRKETRALVEALKKPQVRGSWGEMHLKRAVEQAGLVERCDFDTQVHFADNEGSLRPDMVIHLSGGKHVVVDAKVPMSAFMSAIEAVDETDADRHWADHARQLRQHVDALGSKEYFRKVAASPEFVVLFVPSDAFLQPALVKEPTLHEYAIAKNVLIATPTSLIALLRTVAFAWTQAALQDNLKQVYELGRELYERLSVMGGHLNTLGKSLDRSVKAYNDTVGSMEGRVMVTARKFHTLRVVENQLVELKAAEQGTRPLGSPELVESANAAAGVRAISPTPGTENGIAG